MQKFREKGLFQWKPSSLSETNRAFPACPCYSALKSIPPKNMDMNNTTSSVAYTPRIHTLAGRGNIGDLVRDGGGLGTIHVLGNGGQLGLGKVRASHEVNVKDGGAAEEGILVVVDPRDVHDVVGLVDRVSNWLCGRDESRDGGSHSSQSSNSGKELHDE